MNRTKVQEGHCRMILKALSGGVVIVVFQWARMQWVSLNIMGIRVLRCHLESGMIKNSFFYVLPENIEEDQHF